MRVDFAGNAAELAYWTSDALRKGRRFVFPISVAQFYAAWNSGCRKCKVDPGPPHGLRHTAASWDMVDQGPRLKPYPNKRQVQERGRWAAEKSVQQYSKTAIYLKSLSEVPDNLLRYGSRRKLMMGARADIARN